VAHFFVVVMSELPERATFDDESEAPANPHASVGGVIAMGLAFGSVLRPSHSFWPGPIDALAFEDPPQRMVPSVRQIPSAKRRGFKEAPRRKT